MSLPEASGHQTERRSQRTDLCQSRVQLVVCPPPAGMEQDSRGVGSKISVWARRNGRLDLGG
jgi:hypothetical protein